MVIEVYPLSVLSSVMATSHMVTDTDLWLSGTEVFYLLLNHLNQNVYSYVWRVATILDSLGPDHV